MLLVGARVLGKLIDLSPGPSLQADTSFQPQRQRRILAFLVSEVWVSVPSTGIIVNNCSEVSLRIWDACWMIFAMN